MKVVKVRSPFIIEVNESGAIGSKIDVLIWQYGGSSSSPLKTYTLSKSNPSTTQLSTVYNVSNYVKEYIDNIKATYVPYYGAVEQNNEWVFFQIKRYKLVGSTYTLLDTNDYVGVNGFLNYTDGYQNPTNTNILVLSNTNINNYYYSQSIYPTSTIQYFNLLIDKATATTTTVDVKYERIDGTVYSYTNSLAIGFSGIFNLPQPITPVKGNSTLQTNFINGCKVTITYTPATGSPIVQTFFTYPIEECKYTPVLCDFVNRYGGWQTITFFKAQTNTVAVKGTDYKLMPSAINYNTSKGQVKSFNINGTQTIKLNTGFVDENYSELITDLLLSETVLLDAKPVTVKTQGSDLKVSLKDKLINYEIEFEYAYNLINDVV
jgi:hypothetical protein